MSGLDRCRKNPPDNRPAGTEEVRLVAFARFSVHPYGRDNGEDDPYCPPAFSMSFGLCGRLGSIHDLIRLCCICGFEDGEVWA